MSKKKEEFKKKFTFLMSVFIIVLLLVGVLLPAIFVIVEMFT